MKTQRIVILTVLIGAVFAAVFYFTRGDLTRGDQVSPPREVAPTTPVSPPSGPKDRPNVVLLIIDTLRADKLGCYGFPKEVQPEISPEIDALARRGVLFERVLSQCSWTRPSIGSVLTGLHPRSIGIYKEKSDILADPYTTLAEILKSEGYRTLGITANPNINKIFNFHQGFDDYRDSNVVWKWMKPGQGQKKYDGDHHLPRSREIFADVLDTVKTYGKEPVYVQINLMEVHSPHLVREEYRDTYKDYPVRRVDYDYPREKLERLVRGTLGAVRQVSRDTGEFVEKLYALPGWENTLLIIMSDHGQGLDDHPGVKDSQAHGNLLYESHVRVPLIFYHPEFRGSGSIPGTRIAQPRRVKQPVRLLDLLPTILDYLGALPESSHFHGASLLSLVTGQGPPPQLPEFFTAETRWRKVNKIAVYSGQGDSGQGNQQWNYFENRDEWPGVNTRELQPVGGGENGKATDSLSLHPELGTRMKKTLYLWERQYKAVKALSPGKKLSEKEIRQLKSLGYLK